MIKFFRHIRRSLINENRMGKYFKYAVGEILLVVIGILIALYINNWNQNRISKTEINQSLNKLLVELNADLIDLDDKIEFNSGIVEKLDSCLIILKEPKNYSLSDFDNVFHNVNYTSTFNFNKLTFNEISNSGKLKQLNNEILSDSLINYYNFSLYKVVEQGLIHHTRDNIRTHTLGFDYLNFDDDLDTYQASDFGLQSKSLNDYRSNVQILNAIRLKILLHRLCKTNYESIKKRTRYLIDSITEELKRHQ